MNIFKNYRFYIILFSVLLLVVGVVTDYFGVFVSQELLSTIVSYIISFLIGINVITFNQGKTKNAEDIKKDIKQTMATMKENNSKTQPKSNEINEKEHSKNEVLKENENDKKI